jgi:mannitol/fructose-specific phosphotransferase system IIA component (Ntr-type)
MPATKVIEHVREAHCVPELKGDTREAVIEELVERLVRTKTLTSDGRELLLESILEREEAATTGIGQGIALPHPKTTDDVAGVLPGVEVAVGLHKTGVDFASLDGDPVHIVFLVVSPEKQGYLEVAKRIAALAKGGSAPERWRRVLRQARTPAGIREILQEAWDELAP